MNSDAPELKGSRSNIPRVANFVRNKNKFFAFPDKGRKDYVYKIGLFTVKDQLLVHIILSL